MVTAVEMDQITQRSKAAIAAKTLPKALTKNLQNKVINLCLETWLEKLQVLERLKNSPVRALTTQVLEAEDCRRVETHLTMSRLSNLDPNEEMEPSPQRDSE